MHDDAVAVTRSADAPDGQPQVRLVLNGRDTGVDLPGAVLEASARFGDELLLFLTDDVPFEDGLNICLVGATGKLLDSVRIAAIYATGSLRDLERTNADSMAFRFFAGAMQVRVLPHPKMMLPSLGLSSGIHRTFSAQGRLVVRQLSS